MYILKTLAIVSVTLTLSTIARADTFGNPGNPDDTTGNPNPAGKVEYAYRISKYEISEAMIDAANAGGGLGLTKDTRGPSKPATSISWLEAATFVNWLNTSQGHQAAYNFDGNGNFGLWSSGQAWQRGGENLFRHKDTVYFLPSMDEWYKAAYFDTSGNLYYNYPTGSDAAPTAVANGTTANTAVYRQSSPTGPADITLAGGLSPNGTMGQAGNVWEWHETEYDLVNNFSSSARGFRGASWLNDTEFLSASIRINGDPTDENSLIGFRVASIPEPSSGLLCMFTVAGLMLQRRRSS